MGDLPATQGYGDVAHVTTKGHRDVQCLGCHLWLCRCPMATTGVMLIWLACAAYKGHILVPMAARVRVNIRGPFILPSKANTSLESGLAPVALLLTEGCATNGAKLVWVTYTATPEPWCVQAQAAAKGNVWVHGPTAARV